MTPLPARQPDALGERLTRLLEAAGSEPWCVYSELEVGLPPSIFAGVPGQSGFEPVNPDSGWYLDLVVAMKNALPQLLSDRKEYAALSDSAEQLGVPADVQIEMLVKELSKGQLARVIVAGRGQRRADRERIEEAREREIALVAQSGQRLARIEELERALKMISGEIEDGYTGPEHIATHYQNIARTALQGNKP